MCDLWRYGLDTYVWSLKTCFFHFFSFFIFPPAVSHWFAACFHRNFHRSFYFKTMDVISEEEFYSDDDVDEFFQRIEDNSEVLVQEERWRFDSHPLAVVLTLSDADFHGMLKYYRGLVGDYPCDVLVHIREEEKRGNVFEPDNEVDSEGFTNCDWCKHGFKPRSKYRQVTSQTFCSLWCYMVIVGREPYTNLKVAK